MKLLDTASSLQFPIIEEFLESHELVIGLITSSGQNTRDEVVHPP